MMTVRGNEARFLLAMRAAEAADPSRARRVRRVLDALADEKVSTMRLTPFALVDTFSTTCCSTDELSTDPPP